MPIQHHRTCSICEANCGIIVTAEGRDILSIKGDPDNALSRGHICPKATALADSVACSMCSRAGNWWTELKCWASIALIIITLGWQAFTKRPAAMASTSPPSASPRPASCASATRA